MSHSFGLSSSPSGADSVRRARNLSVLWSGLGARELRAIFFLCTVVLLMGINCCGMLILFRNNIGELKLYFCFPHYHPFLLFCLHKSLIKSVGGLIYFTSVLVITIQTFCLMVCITYFVIKVIVMLTKLFFLTTGAAMSLKSIFATPFDRRLHAFQ